MQDQGKSPDIGAQIQATAEFYGKMQEALMQQGQKDVAEKAGDVVESINELMAALSGESAPSGPQAENGGPGTIPAEQAGNMGRQVQPA